MTAAVAPAGVVEAGGRREAGSGALLYLAALAAGAALSLAAFLGGLGVLGALGRLPPPAVANSLCVDEKLAFHRANPPRAPNVLVIGSSVAWRGFDGAALARAVPGARALNGAFCGLSATQSVFVADWLLDRLPTTRDVVMIAAPQDFETCAARPPTAFDRAMADAFVFEDGPTWPHYLRHFDPRALARNAGAVAALRSGADPLNALVFTPTGHGPMDTEATQASLRYGPVGGLDPACFAALRPLALRLAREGRRFLVAAPPLHPEWRRRYDPDGGLEAAIAARLRDALAGTGATYWNGASALFDAAAFTDAIHVRWSAASRFTAILGEVLLQRAAPNPDAPERVPAEGRAGPGLARAPG